MKVSEIQIAGENNLIFGRLDEAEREFKEARKLLADIQAERTEDKHFIDGFNSRVTALSEVIDFLRTDEDLSAVFRDFERSSDFFRKIIKMNFSEYLLEIATIREKDARVIRELAWRDEVGKKYERSIEFGKLAYMLYEDGVQFYVSACDSINLDSEKITLLEQAGDVRGAQARLADSEVWISAILKDMVKMEEYWKREINSCKESIRLFNEAMNLARVTGDTRKIGELQKNRLALAYSALARKYSARKMFVEAISFFEKERESWRNAQDIFKDDDFKTFLFEGHVHRCSALVALHNAYLCDVRTGMRAYYTEAANCFGKAATAYDVVKDHVLSCSSRGQSLKALSFAKILEWEEHKSEISLLDEAYRLILAAHNSLTESWGDMKSQSITYCTSLIMKVKRSLEYALQAPDDSDRTLVLSKIAEDMQEINKFVEHFDHEQQERYQQELSFIWSYVPVQSDVYVTLHDVEERTINMILNRLGIRNHRPTIAGYIDIEPARPAVGEPFTLVLKLVNAGRISALNIKLHLEFPKEIEIMKGLQTEVAKLPPGPEPIIIKTHLLSAKHIGRYRIAGNGSFMDVLGREWPFLIQPFPVAIPFTREEKKRIEGRTQEETYEKWLRGKNDGR
jgi:tetratricopeptide (TPR) repeat protein